VRQELVVYAFIDFSQCKDFRIGVMGNSTGKSSGFVDVGLL